MNEDLQKLKEIYLADDIDSEDREANLEDIRNWEKDLIENENLLSWQEHDITKQIMERAKKSYIDLSLRLIKDRKLSEEARLSIYSRQDAMLWLISLAGDNPKSALEQINNSIKVALSTN